MKLPIVSRKTLEIVKGNLKIMNESRQKIYDEYIKLQQDMVDLQTYHNEVLITCDKQEYEIEDLKKELKRIKTLCTRNGIIYKKENK